jgi:hypothetical protein
MVTSEFFKLVVWLSSDEGAMAKDRAVAGVAFLGYGSS